ncbi:MAG: Gfo/Idh/MocA family protein [Phycisphaeraceae bacterium]
MPQQTSIDVTSIGGGMIMHDQILPSLLHLQRIGEVGRIQVCATSSARIRDLYNERFEQAFPGHTFEAYPDRSEDPSKRFGDLYKEVIPKMAPRQLVVVATPDHLHYEQVRYALEHDQHVLCVKPLVLKHEHAEELAALAHERGLFLGVEYHKRFDRRNLEARQRYRAGEFGEFRIGEAKLLEPWSYRHSNFQNWFTCDNTDPFTYIGCHYVDLVTFITGLRPTGVALRGVKGKFPNGNEAYMWSHAHVEFENGATLGVLNGLGYPDKGAGTNDQAMTLYGEGTGAHSDCGTILKHNDQFRSVSHGYVDDEAHPVPFRFINPDYMRLIPYDGDGLKPVGYGYESIEANVRAAINVNAACADSPETEALPRRQSALDAIDSRGIIATAANSRVNELVMEAGRLSITNGSRFVRIHHDASPRVELT